MLVLIDRTEIEKERAIENYLNAKKTIQTSFTRRLASKNYSVKKFKKTKINILSALKSMKRNDSCYFTVYSRHDQSDILRSKTSL